MEVSPGELIAEARDLVAALYAGERDGTPTCSSGPDPSDLRQLGITRVGSLTELDTVGVPVYFACRPNSRSLSVTQGKGLNREQAWLGAVMEAAEQHFAGEAARLTTVRTSEKELAGRGRAFLEPRTVKRTSGGYDSTVPIDWVRGVSLFSGAELLVPLGLVAFDTTPEAAVTRRGFQTSTVGLAGALSLADACLHAIFEVIENDATALIDLFGRLSGLVRPVIPGQGGSPALDGLIERLSGAGLSWRLAVIHSATGLPVIGALVEGGEMYTGLGVSTFGGFACRPTAEAAAVSALLEAIQSRATWIAGARDDLRESDYRPGRSMLSTPTGPSVDLTGIPGMATHLSTRDLLGQVLARTKAAGALEIVLVPLGGLSSGLRSVRVVASSLQSAAGGNVVELDASSLARLAPRLVDA